MENIYKNILFCVHTQQVTVHNNGNNNTLNDDSESSRMIRYNFDLN